MEKWTRREGTVKEWMMKSHCLCKGRSKVIIIVDASARLYKEKHQDNRLHLSTERHTVSRQNINVR